MQGTHRRELELCLGKLQKPRERDLKRTLKGELEFAGWGRKERAFQAGNSICKGTETCVRWGVGMTGSWVR